MTVSKLTKTLTLLLLLMGVTHNSYATDIKDHTSYDPDTKMLQIPEIFVKDTLFTNVNLDLCLFVKKFGSCAKPKPMSVNVDGLELKFISAKRVSGKGDSNFLRRNPDYTFEDTDDDGILDLDVAVSITNKATNLPTGGIGSPSHFVNRQKFFLIDNLGSSYEIKNMRSDHGTGVVRSAGPFYLTYVTLDFDRDIPVLITLRYMNFDPKATSIDFLKITAGGKVFRLRDLPID